MRIWIEKGKLVNTFDAWHEMSSAEDFPFGVQPFDAYWHLYFQLYNKYTGEPVYETYRGKGTIVENRIYLGDTDRVDSTLLEYRLGESPTEDSLRELEEFKAGVKAGLKSGGRRTKTKPEPWLVGFDLGKANRRRDNPGENHLYPSPKRNSTRRENIDPTTAAVLASAIGVTTTTAIQMGMNPGWPKNARYQTSRSKASNPIRKIKNRVLR